MSCHLRHACLLLALLLLRRFLKERENQNIFKGFYHYSLSLCACYKPAIMVEMTLYLKMIPTTRFTLGLEKRRYHTVAYLDKNSKK